MKNFSAIIDADDSGSTVSFRLMTMGPINDVKVEMTARQARRIARRLLEVADEIDLN